MNQNRSKFENTKRRLRSISFVLAIFSFQPVFSQKVVLEQGTSKQLIVETVHPFVVRQYAQALRVSSTQDATQLFGADSPEVVLSQRVFAMMQGNYKAFMASWDRWSNTEMEQRDKDASRDASFWVGRWRENFSNGSLKFLNRIEVFDYVFINYQIEKQGKPTFVSTVAFLKEDAKWIGTQRLVNDPVLEHWNSNGNRVQRMADRPIVDNKK
jgi:hypothetical protein